VRAKDEKPQVYLAAVEGGVVKIGHTLRVKARVRSLQGQSCKPVTLIRTIDAVSVRDSVRLERELHWWFDHCRIGGEWFWFCPEMLTYVPETLAEWTHRLRRAGIELDGMIPRRRYKRARKFELMDARA
jgi:hypothetical protein